MMTWRYDNLPATEREQICAWVRMHDIDPGTVPTRGRIDIDQRTQEYLIETVDLRDGYRYVGDDGEIATVTVRRTPRAPLPTWMVVTL